MAIAAGQRGISKSGNRRSALIEERAIIPTGLLAERAGNEALADAGRTVGPIVSRFWCPAIHSPAMSF